MSAWHALCSPAFRMRPFTLPVFFLFVWALALAPREARAQTTTTGPSVTGINNGVPTRLEPNLSTSADLQGQNPHPGSVPVNVVNFEDCAANLVYQFQLAIGAINTSYNLDVWAGTQDCTQLANRQSATAVCWPVAPITIATTNPFTINVRMQDIVSQVTDTSHTVTYTPANSDVCQLQTQTGATNITLYFFFETDGNATGTAQQYPLVVDTRAGDVQGAIGVGVGDTILIVNIPSTTDPDTQEYNVYCDPPPGLEGSMESVGVDAPSNNGTCPAQVPDTGPLVDTGADALASVDTGVADAGIADTAPAAPMLDDAGGNRCGVALNDAQIPAPGGCSSSSVLVSGGGGAGLASFIDDAGQTVIYEAGTTTAVEEGGVAISGGNQAIGFQYGQPYNNKYLCGTGGVSSTTVNVQGLKDGYYYNIAVAAVDGAGNVGPLSNVVCGEPVPVADFWRLYYEAGGRAGGGFCSTDGAGLPAGTSGLGILMVASMVGIIRKRRRS